MNLSKKAIAAYIGVICITSVIISFLFLAILGTLYAEENPLCQEIKFIVEETCVLKDGVRTKIINQGEGILELLINGGNKQTLADGEIKLFNFNTKDESKIEFSPLITIQGNPIYCDSKKTAIDTKLVIKPCN
jgi:hypothetical protein